MFRIDANPTFSAIVRMPAADGAEPETFTARFRVLPVSVFRSFDGTPEGSEQMLRATIADLGDIVGEDGKPLPFDEKLLAAVLDNPMARAALFRAYLDTAARLAAGN